jgi:hypothetical protein
MADFFVGHGDGACEAVVIGQRGRREAVRKEARTSAWACTWKLAVGEAEKKEKNQTEFWGRDVLVEDESGEVSGVGGAHLKMSLVFT